MWQCGQIAETMSRSSDCSTAQSALALGSGLVRPFWFTMRRQPGRGRALAQLEVAPVGGQVDSGVGVPVGVDDGHGLVPAPDQGVAGQVVGLAQRGRPEPAGGRRGRGEGRGVLARSPGELVDGLALGPARPGRRADPALAGRRGPGRGGGAAGGSVRLAADVTVAEAAVAGIVMAPAAVMASGKRAAMSLLYRITRTKSSIPRGPPGRIAVIGVDTATVLVLANPSRRRSG